MRQALVEGLWRHKKSPHPGIITACFRKGSFTKTRNETVSYMERETGLEPATACLEGRNSTTELLPQSRGART